MKNNKVIFLCNFKHYGYDALSYLVDLGCTPLLMSHHNEVDKKELLNIVPNETVLCSSSDMIKAIFPPEFLNKGYSQIPPEPHLIQSLSECQNIFIPMMERLNYGGISSIKIIEYFYRYVSIWNGIIKHTNPDCIVFHNTPHEGFNFIAYSVAQYYGIRTLMPERILMGERFFFLERMYDFPIYKKNDSYSMVAADLGLLNKIQDKTKKAFVRKNYTHDIMLRAKHKMIRLLNIFKKDFDGIYSLSDGYPPQWRSNISIMRSKYSVRKLRNFYQKKAITPSANCKYIYFPLHLQPERTTLPMGRHFWNHQVVIDYLIASLPLGWKIYVKEHPRQFTRSELRVSLARDQEFFNNLTNHSSVELIDLEFDSNELITSSMCVATITGTAGWEALVKNKPVCVFGYPWYVNCPEVFKVGSSLALNKFLTEVNNNKVKINADIVNSYEYWMKEKICYKGALTPDHVKEKDKAKNSIMIAKAIWDAINRNKVSKKVKC